MKIIDMHCDTISKIFADREAGADAGEAKLRENKGHLDLISMKKSGYLLQNFALFVEKNECDDPWNQAERLYGIYREEIEKNKDIIAPVYKYDDIAQNEAAGKMSALLTVEEGAVCKGDIGKLKTLYDWGVRMLTLTWNYPNELGFPNMDIGEYGQTVGNHNDFESFFYTPDRTRGLTEKGREFICCMEQIGMIPDVSHMSDAGFYDVLECTHKPFVASHSNARSVCRCVRNMSDEMIIKLGERGGVMGLNFCADFVKEVPKGQHNFGDMDAIVEQAKYITSIGGMEILGLGSDFDGMDTNEALPGTQSMELLWNALKKAGFYESNLDKIFCGNVLRLYKDTLK